ncbi:Uncharacterised protein [Candidatus Burarchaeum australiense]|nr:Uncharacterised protein [Candidatus Burarchaeum australiense]
MVKNSTPYLDDKARAELIEIIINRGDNSPGDWKELCALAVDELGYKGGPGAVLPLVEILETHPLPSVRKGAADAIWDCQAFHGDDPSIRTALEAAMPRAGAVLTAEPPLDQSIAQTLVCVLGSMANSSTAADIVNYLVKAPIGLCVDDAVARAFVKITEVLALPAQDKVLDKMWDHLDVLQVGFKTRHVLERATLPFCSEFILDELPKNIRAAQGAIVQRSQQFRAAASPTPGNRATGAGNRTPPPRATV